MMLWLVRRALRDPVIIFLVCVSTQQCSILIKEAWPDDNAYSIHATLVFIQIHLSTHKILMS